MRSKIFTACLMALAPMVGHTQQSLFQTSDGASSLYLSDSTAAINLGDSKASVGFTHHDNKDRSLVWGYDVFATANKGISSLFSSDKAKAPEGGFDVTLGSHFLATSNKQTPPSQEDLDWSAEHPGQIRQIKRPKFFKQEDWALVDLGYSYSSFLVSPTAVAANANKTSFHKYRAIAAYNYYFGGNIIWGVAAGVEHRNNTGDLASAQFQTILAPAPGGTVGSTVKTQTGFYGTYKEYVAAPVYTDVILFPKHFNVPGFGNPIGFDFVTRSDVASANRSGKGGVGLFIFKKGNSNSPLGGVVGTYDGTKFQVSLTTGITIGQ